MEELTDFINNLNLEEPIIDETDEITTFISKLSFKDKIYPKILPCNSIKKYHHQDEYPITIFEEKKLVLQVMHQLNKFINFLLQNKVKHKILFNENTNTILINIKDKMKVKVNFKELRFHYHIIKNPLIKWKGGVCKNELSKNEKQLLLTYIS